MHCASCAITLEKGLTGVQGVHDAQVNFGTGKAVVEYDPAITDLSSLEKTVVKSGYEVIHDQVTIRIGGMTCAICVQTIEKALNNLDGVTSATVNLALERAYVTYIPSQVSLKKMQEVIVSAGYQYLGTDKEGTLKSGDERLQKELKDKKIRVIIGFIISAVLMGMMAAPPELMHILIFGEFLIATPAFIWLGMPIFRAAIGALQTHTLNMDVMYAMGTTVAYLASVMGTFEIILDMQYIFYETAIMLISFLMLGRYLEAKAKGRTSTAIQSLIQLQPDTAAILIDGSEKKVPVEEVRVGDQIRIRPGDRIPVDGIVLSGTCFIDESMVTGEPLPVEKLLGDEIIAGTLATGGSLILEAHKVGSDTMLARIIRMVEEAQGSKPPVQRLADKVVTWFIPVVLIIAIGALGFWFFIAKAGLQFSLQTFIAILVIACPCALGLATPTAVTVGVGRGAELGILIRNGANLEVSDRLTTVLFDKTGTLTFGKPTVTDVDVISGTRQLLLSYAASIEFLSNHPLGEAIIKYAEKEGITPADVQNFSQIAGKGLEGVIAGGHVCIGNQQFFVESGGILTTDQEQIIQRRQSEGKTTVLISRDNQLIGVISISDTIKDSAASAVAALAKMGISSALVTGDNQRTATAVGKMVQITKIIAGVLPDGKEQEVNRLQKSGEIVAFVGDGINDAPALARADTGIAIGSGTDVAIESADIILMRDDISDAVAAIQLSRKVMGRIRLNLFWAFAYNIILIPLAAGVMYPILIFRPEYGALAMALSSVTVISLSLMLRSYTPPIRQKIGKISKRTRTAKDPICGMYVEMETAKFISRYRGKTYYFCNKGCKETFDANPENYQ